MSQRILNFFLGMTIQFDILFAINSVSKSLQSEDMHIDIAAYQLKSLLAYFQNYREKRFASAMISAKEITNEMEIESKFQEKRVIRGKIQFDESVDCNNIQSAEESFRNGYFSSMVDQVISSLKTRFEQFQMYENVFGFLFDFKKLKSLDEDVLKRYSLNL